MDTFCPVELAEKLIETETVTPVEDPGLYQRIASLLRSHGIEPEIQEYSDVQNLKASFGSGTSICFNGHLDVVEPEGEWEKTQPFKAFQDTEYIYGRGASDMKGGLAAEIAAFIELKQEGFPGKLTLMIGGDEELGGRHGTAEMVNGYDYAVIGEPTDLNVQVGTRGVLWLDVTLYGQGIHASRASQAELKVTEELPDAVDRLENIEFDQSDDKLPDPGLEVTKIETTSTYNSVPGKVEIGLDIRYLPGMEEEEIKEKVRESLAGIEASYEVKTRVNHGGAYKLQDEKLRQASLKALESVGAEPVETTEGGASDGRHFARNGTPFVEIGPEKDTAHSEDERARKESIKKLKKAYKKLARDLAT